MFPPRNPMLKAYSIGYDMHNDIMITPFPGKYDETSITEIRTRFRELKRIAKKHAPGKYRTIESIEKMCYENHKGNISDKVFLHRLRLMAVSNGVSPAMIDQQEARINIMESQHAGTIKKNPFIGKFDGRKKILKEFGAPQKLRLPLKTPSRGPDHKKLIRRMFGVK